VVIHYEEALYQVYASLPFTFDLQHYQTLNWRLFQGSTTRFVKCIS